MITENEVSTCFLLSLKPHYLHFTSSKDLENVENNLLQSVKTRNRVAKTIRVTHNQQVQQTGLQTGQLSASGPGTGAGAGPILPAAPITASGTTTDGTITADPPITPGLFPTIGDTEEQIQHVQQPQLQ